MKKLLIAIGILLIAAIAAYRFYFMELYSEKLDEQEQKWLSEEFIPRKIVGVIHELEPPTGDRCFTNFIIKMANNEKFSSGVCMCGQNEEFANFAEERDSVIKPSNSEKIVVIKLNGERKEFLFPFCDDL